MEELEPFYGAALARCPGIGGSRLQNLVAALGSARAVWEAAPADWQVPDFGKTLIQRLAEFRREKKDLPQKLHEECHKLGIRLLTIWDEDYPTMLKEIYDAPAILYVKGSIQQEAKRIAMVGARKFTPYGEGVAKSFGAGLAKAGLTVVSGGARGIDTASHKGALQVPGGRTVAVLGCGVDVAYPPENRRLFHNIVDGGGALLSEYVPGTPPLPAYFPARNRLIAGLGDCTLIMEAGEVSGTLHTASFTAAQGKEVFVLPNSIYFENAKGGMKLLEDGGNVLLNTDSVIDSVSQAQFFKRIGDPYYFEYLGETMANEEEIEQEFKADIYQLRKRAEAAPEELDDDEWKLLISDELSSGPKNIDELCRALVLPFYRISQLIIEMKLVGWVTDQCGKFSLTIR